MPECWKMMTNPVLLLYNWVGYVVLMINVHHHLDLLLLVCMATSFPWWPSQRL